VAGELTLSFRSTEFIDDAVRDGKSTNELEIKELGWAFGQIAEMEAWYAQLRADPNLLGGGQNFNVTGYSLGGHLATAFNILRREAGGASPILNTYTFNGAGRFKPGKRLTDVLNTFNRLRRETSLKARSGTRSRRRTGRRQQPNRVPSRSINAEAAAEFTVVHRDFRV
jgi:hypothetical protein